MIVIGLHLGAQAANRDIPWRRFRYCGRRRLRTMCGMQRAAHNPYRRHAQVLASFVGLLLLGNTALADPDAEREALARLIHEMEALEPLIATAESQASPDARIHFRYEWLRQDLKQIRTGIQEHIDAPRTEPRTFPPLRGDYRQ